MGVRHAPAGGQYAPLTPADIDAIHETSIKLLDAHGVQVPHAGARETFRMAGAQVDGARVRLSRAMIEDALAVVPHRVYLASRDGENDLELSGRRVHFGTGGSPGFVLPAGAHDVRPAQLRDVAQLAMLADALSELDFFLLPVTPTAVSLERLATCRFYAALRHTRKHIMGGLIHLAGALAVLEMASALAGGVEALRERPFISAMTSWMVSPLTFDPDVTEILTFWCEQGMPVALSAAPMAGSTSPVTLAGTLTQLNAEQLAGIVYTQLVRAGSPVLAGYIPGQMNPASGGYLGGAAEFGMMQAGAAQLAQYYDVPIYCSAGMTDSKLPDQQAGYEKMLTLQLTAMAGASYIHHAVGMIENMNAVSYEQMVIDNDIITMVKRALRGIATDDEHLAGDVIARVGPGGNYLMDDHTLRHMRSEFSYPPLADRRGREEWRATGGLDTRQRAAARVAQLLGEAEHSLLPADVDRDLRSRFDVSDGLDIT
jgi:trimethylamine---corrinoid protein Co-methyltransferase